MNTQGRAGQGMAGIGVHLSEQDLWDTQRKIEAYLARGVTIYTSDVAGI